MNTVKTNIEKIYFDTTLFVPTTILQTFISEQARVKNVDPVAFVAHLIPTVAHLMSGKKTEVIFHETWKEPTVLYHILVASKSSSKSPVMNLLSKEVNAIAKDEATEAFRLHREAAEEEEGVADDEEPPPKFNHSSFIRIFDAATGQGILHALAAGSGNMLGSIDEMSNWPGLTDPMLSTALLSCFNAMPWRSLTVSHNAISVETPYINLAGNMQTELMVNLLKKPDPQGIFSRFSLWAVRDSQCKRFDLDEQLEPLDPSLEEFNIKAMFEKIVEFHKEKVLYGFPAGVPMEAIKTVIKQLNAMSDATEDEDLKSLISKCISKLIRTAAVQCCLRIAAEDTEDMNSGTTVIDGITYVNISPEDVTKAKRCILYTIASYLAITNKQSEDEMGDVLLGESEFLTAEQPSLPKARKYRRKSGEIPDPATSSIGDLLLPKIQKQLLNWSHNSDENDEISVSKIHHKRWFVRSSSVPDADMLEKLIQLMVHHGIAERRENMIKLIRESRSSLIQSKIQVLKEEVSGYLI